MAELKTTKNMENLGEKQLLRDPQQEPHDEFLEKILSSEVYLTYKELQSRVAGMGMVAEWRYYKDGKSWLCKITRKNKTVVWMSLWENYIRTSFYFTEKTREGIIKLESEDPVLLSFKEVKPIGKLIPLILEIRHCADLEKFERIARYKAGTM